MNQNSLRTLRHPLRTLQQGRDRRESLRRQNNFIAELEENPQKYPSWHRVGAFTVKVDSARVRHHDKDTGIRLESWDKVMQLDLIASQAPQLTRDSTRQNFREMADRIRTGEVGDDAQHMMGFTHRGIARLAVRTMGFQQLPFNSVLNDIDRRQTTQRLRKEYELFTGRGKKGEPMGGVHVIYQRTEDFLDRFSEQDSGLLIPNEELYVQDRMEFPESE